MPAGAEQPLATPHLELVAAVPRLEGRRFSERLQQRLGLTRRLAERKFVVQAHQRLGRARTIAVSQPCVGEAEPDGRRLDGLLVEEPLVDRRRVIVLAH
jgi:hypothetical protein